MGVVADQLETVNRDKVVKTQFYVTVDEAGTYTVSIVDPVNNVVDVATLQTDVDVAAHLTEFTAWVTEQWGTP